MNAVQSRVSESRKSWSERIKSLLGASKRRAATKNTVTPQLESLEEREVPNGDPFLGMGFGGGYGSLPSIYAGALFGSVTPIGSGSYGSNQGGGYDSPYSGHGSSSPYGSYSNPSAALDGAVGGGLGFGILGDIPLTFSPMPQPTNYFPPVSPFGSNPSLQLPPFPQTNPFPAAPSGGNTFSTLGSATSGSNSLNSLLNPVLRNLGYTTNMTAQEQAQAMQSGGGPYLSAMSNTLGAIGAYNGYGF